MARDNGSCARRQLYVNIQSARDHGSTDYNTSKGYFTGQFSPIKTTACCSKIYWAQGLSRPPQQPPDGHTRGTKPRHWAGSRSCNLGYIRVQRQIGGVTERTKARV